MATVKKKRVTRASITKAIKDKLPTTNISSLTVITAEIDYPYLSGNNAVRHAPGRHRLRKEALAYRAVVANQIRRAGLSLRFTGPLRVDFQLIAPTMAARDADNAMKTIKDALTKAEFWVDDSNRVIRAGSWEWAERAEDQPAKVVVTVRGYAP